MCLVGPVLMFFVQEDGEDYFWQANLGKQTFLSLFLSLATFANLVKKCASFGKCKSYNAKHGWVGLLVWTYGQGSCQKISTKWCV